MYKVKLLPCHKLQPFYTSLYIYDLDENGGIISGWAWADYDNYELVDTSHIVENFNKIGKYEDKY